MNNKIREYIKAARDEELIRRGLCEYKYYDTAGLSEEDKSRLKYDDVKHAFYEIIPYEVSDEEYNEIIKIKVKNKKSKLANIFYAISVIIFLIGFSYGLIAATNPLFFGDYKLHDILVIWYVSFVSGLTFIGLGKVISLLEYINNK